MSDIIESIIMPDGRKLKFAGSGGAPSGDYVTKEEFNSTVGNIQTVLNQIINGTLPDESTN